ncbi:MAG: alpha/beta hydrolase [Candidatus Andeanibacterium colombiense]|uniref:Alpha/beta hydrolase n=1 Tax=Candidatus Andeanibacterium colombiense TaxID=3121345 RepID=A0AAJ5X2J7_9SPHN|nr:MAG: alpha/beta hydrolase [Sphingomonadaceae bacterium]
MSKWAYSTEGFDREVYRIDGTESVVYAIGPEDAPPAVYFHGGGTFHGFEWMREFADEFRMISPIHPGFGESGDGDIASMDDYVMHYEMLFAALGLERFHLLGASMGGHMAARYAGEHADEIDRLVLISPAGLKSDTVAIPDWSRIAPADMRGMFVESLDWLEPFWPADPTLQWLELRQREGAMAMRIREDLDQVDAKTRSALAEFDRPALLLWGSADQVVPQEFIPVWQEVLPQAEVTVIPGGAHLLLDENAAARKAAKDFLLGK